MIMGTILRNKHIRNHTRTYDSANININLLEQVLIDW